jgi:putative transposase
MKDWQSQAHVKWDCKFHVAILPKHPRKVMYGRLRRGIGQILRDLCRQKDIELVEGKAMPDDIHMLLSVPPRYSIAMTIGYLKGQERDPDPPGAATYQRDVIRPELLGTGLLSEHLRIGRSPDPTVYP